MLLDFLFLWGTAPTSHSFSWLIEELEEFHLVDLVNGVLGGGVAFLPPEILSVRYVFLEVQCLLYLPQHIQIVLAIIWHHCFVEERGMMFCRWLQLFERFFQLIPINGYAMSVNVSPSRACNGIVACGKEMTGLWRLQNIVEAARSCLSHTGLLLWGSAVTPSIREWLSTSRWFHRLLLYDFNVRHEKIDWIKN